MKITWNEIVNAIKGRLVVGELQGEFCGVSTDTRTLKTGELFIALIGENFDGHNFIEAALQKGACGAVVNRGRGWATQQQQKFIIEVEDSLAALGDIAKLWRERHNVKVVAITGSNGKTTTKDMVASVLSQRYKVLKTEGNLNNLIGLPLTVLKIDESHEVAVLELGMNAFGEIRRLSEICQPDIAMITNIGSGHLEGLGSIDGVAKAKGEILENLKADGTFIFNADDKYLIEMAKGWKGRRISFAQHNVSADVKTLYIDYNKFYGSAVELSMVMKRKVLYVKLYGPGEHNAYNATAAAAVGIAMDLDLENIQQGLEEWRAYKGRFALDLRENGVTVIDDTYNANPSSVKIALRTLASIKGLGRGMAVLGDMLELGDHAEQAHYEMGRMAVESGLQYLFLLGPLSTTYGYKGARDAGMEERRVIVLNDHNDITTKLNPMLTGGDWVLVKGSRGMRMEKAADLIMNPNPPGTKPKIA